MASHKLKSGDGANYSTTSDALLCKICKHGQVIETDSGNTMIICRKTDGEGTPPLVLNQLVTKCNLYEDKQNLRMWAEAPEIEIEDGHAWIKKYVANLGNELIRVDTLDTRAWIVRGYSDDRDVDWGTYDRLTKQWSQRGGQTALRPWWRRLVDRFTNHHGED